MEPQDTLKINNAGHLEVGGIELKPGDEFEIHPTRHWIRCVVGWTAAMGVYLEGSDGVPYVAGLEGMLARNWPRAHERRDVPSAIDELATAAGHAVQELKKINEERSRAGYPAIKSLSRLDEAIRILHRAMNARGMVYV